MLQPPCAYLHRCPEVFIDARSAHSRLFARHVVGGRLLRTHLWIEGHVHAPKTMFNFAHRSQTRITIMVTQRYCALYESHHLPAGPATQLVKFCAGHVTGYRTSDQRKCSRYEWEMSAGLGLLKAICFPHGHSSCIITLCAPSKAPLPATGSTLNVAVHDHAAAHLTHIHGITD